MILGKKIITLTRSLKTFGNLRNEAMLDLRYLKLYPKINSFCVEINNIRCQTCKCCFGAWNERKPEVRFFCNTIIKHDCRFNSDKLNMKIHQLLVQIRLNDFLFVVIIGHLPH